MIVGSWETHFWIISVMVVPGATALTRMPSGPYSMAAVSVRLLTARLAAAYAASPELPLKLPTLLLLTIAPLPAVARMALISAIIASQR
jgi:hypothetical protein